MKSKSELRELPLQWKWRRGPGRRWMAVSDASVLVSVDAHAVTINGTEPIPLCVICAVVEANHAKGLRASARRLAASVREMQLNMAKVADEATAVELELWSGSR